VFISLISEYTWHLIENTIGVIMIRCCRLGDELGGWLTCVTRISFLFRLDSLDDSDVRTL
jgi:hypothetical protein